MQGTVAGLAIERGEVRGVQTLDGRRWSARSVVLTAGTFLRGVIHLGLDTRVPAGRAGDSPAVELAQVIEGYGVAVERFKTGTPPRIDGRSVDLGRLARQEGDPTDYWFSFYERSPHPEQLPCFLTWTGEQLRDIISSHLGQSALYGGAIASRGPRYCPSIEDKIVKFPDAERHQVFLEPEGLDTAEMYVNGLSTSLPPEVQLAFLRTVPGLESVKMTRPGYAIEYDYYPPTQLGPTLEYREIDGFFLAGQVNGTTGYEEAAGQGVVAGLNAAAKVLDREPVFFGRDEAFLGVLVDDLVSRGVDEPYRLFTSRSEYRLLLRQDNALRRIISIAESRGLLVQEELRTAHAQLAREEAVLGVSRETWLDPIDARPALEASGSSAIAERTRVADLARRPGMVLVDLLGVAGVEVDADDAAWADIELKYEGYMRRERAAANRIRSMEDFILPELEYPALNSLSFEAREKLAIARPTTLGQASRIPGVSPSDIQSLVFESMKQRRR